MERRPPYLGFASVALAAVAFLLPLLLAAVATGDTKEQQAWGSMGRFAQGLLAAGPVAAVGAVAGGVSLARRERPTAVASFGIALSVVVAVWALVAVRG